MDPTLLVWHRTSWLHHCKTSGQNQGKRQVCSLSLHGVGQPVLQVWGFFFLLLGVSISRVFQPLPVAVHPSCSARLCVPSVLSLASTHGMAEGWLRSSGGCRAGGFLSGALKLLHLHAFPARRRNDSVRASPPWCRGQAGEWVR